MAKLTFEQQCDYQEQIEAKYAKLEAGDLSFSEMSTIQDEIDELYTLLGEDGTESETDQAEKTETHTMPGRPDLKLQSIGNGVGYPQSVADLDPNCRYLAREIICDAANKQDRHWGNVRCWTFDKRRKMWFMAPLPSLSDVNDERLLTIKGCDDCYLPVEGIYKTPQSMIDHLKVCFDNNVNERSVLFVPLEEKSLFPDATETTPETTPPATLFDRLLAGEFNNLPMQQYLDKWNEANKDFDNSNFADLENKIATAMSEYMAAHRSEIHNPAGLKLTQQDIDEAA